MKTTQERNSEYFEIWGSTDMELWKMYQEELSKKNPDQWRLRVMKGEMHARLTNTVVGY